MPHIVAKMPRYDCGTGTIVWKAFRFDCEDGGCSEGDVQVAICARRRTVSSGNLIDKSRAEPIKVATDQLAGFIAGSSPR